MQTVTVDDGTRIACEQHRERDTLYHIHGESSPDFWDPVLRFDDEYSVIGSHRRGFGQSGGSTRYSLEQSVKT